MRAARKTAGMLMLACLAAAGARAEVSLVREGIMHDALYDMCGDAQGALAVGVAGLILERKQGSADWAPAAVGLTEGALLGVSCAGERRIAVGQGGQILRGDAQGWQAVASGSDQRLLAVAANSAGLVVAVGGFGTVLVSRDDGEHWETQSFDWPAIVEDYAEPHLYDVSVSEQGVVTVVGEFELVMRSEDGGLTWSRVHRGEASLFGLDIAADGTGYAVGQQGRVLRTTDGGASWNELKSPVDAILLGVWAENDRHVVLSGMRSMLESNDGGATWTALEGADIAVGWYAALMPDQNGRILTVGNHGRLLALGVTTTNDQ